MENKYGREVIEVSRWFPSSKLCSSCGWKNVDLQLNERQWDCLVCGSSHCRDVNAAINLRNEGIKIKIGLSSPELTPLAIRLNLIGPEYPKVCRVQSFELWFLCRGPYLKVRTSP